MRYLYLFIPLLWSSVSFGQTERKMTPIHIPTNIERYQLDYELKDYTFVNGDSSILTLINLEQYEHLRLQNQDVEISDDSTEKIIILFSIDKAIARKTKRISLNQTREN
jgi:hypothetical protein